MKCYIGVDPGKCGGIAFNWCGPEHASDQWLAYKMPETEKDIFDLFASEKQKWPGASYFAIIERLTPIPRIMRGVCASFKLGVSYGFLRACLFAHELPFQEVLPVKWQTVMGCRSKGDKNVTKAKAQQLFPWLKITHATADALLLAQYCRRSTFRIAAADPAVSSAAP